MSSCNLTWAYIVKHVIYGHMGIYSNTWAYKVIIICGHIWTYIVIHNDTWPNKVIMVIDGQTE